MKNVIILDGSLPPLMFIQLTFDVQDWTIAKNSHHQHYILFEHKRSNFISGLEKPVYSRILASLIFFLVCPKIQNLSGLFVFPRPK